MDFSTPGEVLLGTVGGTKAALADSVPGPFAAIGRGFKGFFSSLRAAIKSPKKLIPVLILAAIWLILDVLEALGIETVPTEYLSFLTYAKGGLSTDKVTMWGGLFGKCLYAGGFSALIASFKRDKNVKRRKLTEIIKGSFGIPKGSLYAYFFGMTIAFGIYYFISAGDVKPAFMTGLAASYISARAALNRGFLQNFLGSFTAKGKEKVGDGTMGLIRGISVGFAAAALVSLDDEELVFILVAGVLLLAAVVFTVIKIVKSTSKKKGVEAA